MISGSDHCGAVRCLVLREYTAQVCCQRSGQRRSGRRAGLTHMKTKKQPHLNHFIRV